MNRKTLLYVSIPFLAAVTVFPAGNAFAADPAVQAQWDKLCKSCHGVDGKGVETKAKVLKIEVERMNLLRDEAVKMPRDDKKKILLEGKEKMPAYEKKLSAAEIDPLLDIVEALQKAK